jgi:hypothetical protein
MPPSIRGGRGHYASMPMGSPCSQIPLSGFRFSCVLVHSLPLFQREGNSKSFGDHRVERRQIMSVRSGYTAWIPKEGQTAHGKGCLVWEEQDEMGFACGKINCDWV